METDEKGRIKLSMKALIERPEGMPEERFEPRGDRPPRRDRDDRPPRRDRDDRPRREHAPVEAGHDAPVAATETAPVDHTPKPAE
jgi:polyribonucleotide nucleotidyltransferase